MVLMAAGVSGLRPVSPACLESLGSLNFMASPCRWLSGCTCKPMLCTRAAQEDSALSAQCLSQITNLG